MAKTNLYEKDVDFCLVASVAVKQQRHGVQPKVVVVYNEK